MATWPVIVLVLLPSPPLKMLVPLLLLVVPLGSLLLGLLVLTLVVLVLKHVLSLVKLMVLWWLIPSVPPPSQPLSKLVILPPVLLLGPSVSSALVLSVAVQVFNHVRSLVSKHRMVLTALFLTRSVLSLSQPLPKVVTLKRVRMVNGVTLLIPLVPSLAVAVFKLGPLSVLSTMYKSTLLVAVVLNPLPPLSPVTLATVPTTFGSLHPPGLLALPLVVAVLKPVVWSVVMMLMVV